MPIDPTNDSLDVGPRAPYSPDRVPLYFEHPLDEQLLVEPIHGEEVNVAVDINRGRALALTHSRSPYEEPPPTVDPDFSLNVASGGRCTDPESYYDSIADILQAVEFAGWDPADMCRHALSLQQQVKKEGQESARDARGPRKTPPPRQVRGRRRNGQRGGDTGEADER